MSFIAALVFRDSPSEGAPKGAQRQAALALLGAGRGRGQDDSGAWTGDHTAIAVRMHRTRDLTPDGAQPFLSANGHISVALDGYVANAKPLRRELENAGIRLRGHADAELVAEGAAHWGLNRLLQRLDGAFSIVLWDNESGALHLVRDRLGARPLYALKIKNGYAVASDTSAFSNLADFTPTLNMEAARTWLNWGCVPPPQTLLQDVVCVPPAHRLMLRANDDTIPAAEPYWTAAGTLEEIALRGGRERDAGDNTAATAQAAALDVALGLVEYPPVQAAALRTALHTAHEAGFSTLKLATPDGAAVQTAFDALSQLGEPVTDPLALSLWLTLRRSAADTPVCLAGCGLSTDPLEPEPRPRLRRFLGLLPRGLARLVPARFAPLLRDAHASHAESARLWDLGLPCPDVILPRLDLAHEAQTAFYDFELRFCLRDLPALDRIAAAAQVELRLPQADPRLLERGLPHWPQAPYNDIATWLRGPLRPRVADLMTPDILRMAGLDDPAPQLAAWQEFLAGDNTRTREIWALTVFCAWAAKRFKLG